MAQATRTFRIFVSSAFSDMKAERNALQEYVFPRLRELCLQHDAHFRPLTSTGGRWCRCGVREKIEERT